MLPDNNTPHQPPLGAVQLKVFAIYNVVLAVYIFPVSCLYLIPYNICMKKLAAFVMGITLAVSVVLLFARQASAPSTDKPPAASTAIEIKVAFDKSLHPIDKPGSLWWVVSKNRPIDPIDYAPEDLVTPAVALRPDGGSSEMRLRAEPAAALEKMISDTKKINLNLMLVSGYRSYQTQVSVYNGWVQKYGQAGADKISARPGLSEHQTGLSADLGATSRKCELEICFVTTAEGAWLAANAYKYGFIIRYPEGKHDVTGYEFEPWHLRYVGTALADELHKQNIQTLEEFFGIAGEKQPF